MKAHPIHRHPQRKTSDIGAESPTSPHTQTTKATKTTTERYQLSRLSAAAKEQLIEEILRWALTIWRVDAAGLRNYWLEQKSLETIIYTLRDADGRLVGSTTIKIYRIPYEGRDLFVGKVGLGVDPAQRGSKFALRCMAQELVRWKLAHPLRPSYVFGTLIHPVAYKLCCDILGDALYPYYKNPDNPELLKLAQHLAWVFGVAKADSPHPFVYQELFSAIETLEDIDYWRTHRRPEVQFYVEHCPDYHCSSDCLIGIAPLELTHVLPLMVRTLVRDRVDRWRGRRARLTAPRPPRPA